GGVRPVRAVVRTGEDAVGVIVRGLYLIGNGGSVAEADPADVLAPGVAAEDARAAADANTVVAGPRTGAGIVLAGAADQAGVLRPCVSRERPGAVVHDAPVAARPSAGVVVLARKVHPADVLGPDVAGELGVRDLNTAVAAVRGFGVQPARVLAPGVLRAVVKRVDVLSEDDAGEGGDGKACQRQRDCPKSSVHCELLPPP